MSPSAPLPCPHLSTHSHRGHTSQCAAQTISASANTRGVWEVSELHATYMPLTHTPCNMQSSQEAKAILGQSWRVGKHVWHDVVLTLTTQRDQKNMRQNWEAGRGRRNQTWAGLEPLYPYNNGGAAWIAWTAPFMALAHIQ